MENNRYHFAIKIAVIAQTTELLRKFIESIPGVTIDADEEFRFLKVYSFPLYSDSMVIRVDLWALPADVRQRGDAQILCSDASIVFYVSTSENDLLSLLSVFHRDIRGSNPQCKYVCCGELNENSLIQLGKASGFTILNIENMEKQNAERVFFQTVISVLNQIPNPPEPSALLYKNIRLGSLLLDNPVYKKALSPVSE